MHIYPLLLPCQQSLLLVYYVGCGWSSCPWQPSYSRTGNWSWSEHIRHYLTTRDYQGGPCHYEPLPVDDIWNSPLSYGPCLYTYINYIPHVVICTAINEQNSVFSLTFQEKRKTKTVAHSFSPEFSHLFDLAVPLSCSAKADGTSVTLAQKLAEGCIFVELWHQPPKRSASFLTGGWKSDTTGTGAVTGRRLAHGAKDVLLGRAQVPLSQLLQKSTGRNH